MNTQRRERKRWEQDRVGREAELFYSLSGGFPKLNKEL